MSSIDISKYVTALSEESPTGPDLDMEGDADYQQLDIVSKSTPDQVIRVPDPDNQGGEIDKVIPGESADPKAILEVAETLFGKTRDLRICAPLTYALTRLHGLPGLAAGLQIVAELLTNFWEKVHPQVSADYDFDVGYRARVLMGLADRELVLRAVREAPFAEARAVGRFSMRDLEVVRGELPPLEGQGAPSTELIQAAVREGDAEVVAARKAALSDCVTAIDAIDAAFREATGATGPELGALRKLLVAAQGLFSEEGPAAGPVDEAGGEDTALEAGSASRGGAQRLASRADAKKQLDTVAEFLERTEPAHPAAMFVRRASKLLDMSFLEIIKNLAPDAMDGVRHLGGLPDDDD